MVTAERIVSLVIILVGAVFCMSSIGLGIGRPGSPGSGFVPFIIGMILILLSVGVMIEEGRTKEAKGRPALFQGGRSVAAMAVLASLLAYALLLDILGFILTTFLLLIFLFRVSEKRIARVVGAAIVTTMLSYFLFDYFLEVALPVGIFGY